MVSLLTQQSIIKNVSGGKHEINASLTHGKSVKCPEKNIWTHIVVLQMSAWVYLLRCDNSQLMTNPKTRQEYKPYCEDAVYIVLTSSTMYGHFWVKICPWDRIF